MHVSTDFPEKTVNGTEYMILPCGALIKKDEKEIYLWFSSSKAPQSWIGAFHKALASSLPEVKKESARFCRF